MRIALFLHLISNVVWIGGMFLAYVVLRPVAGAVLEPPQRLRLWEGLFRRFFLWVWAAVVLILLSGFTMMGEMSAVPHAVLLMAVVGFVMVAVFLYVFFVPFVRLKQAVAAEDWKAGGVALATIRKLVAINLALGIINIAVGTLRPLV